MRGCRRYTPCALLALSIAYIVWTVNRQHQHQQALPPPPPPPHPPPPQPQAQKNQKLERQPITAADAVVNTLQHRAAAQLPAAAPCTHLGWIRAVERDAAADHWLLPSVATGVYSNDGKINSPHHALTFVSHSTVDHLPTLVPLVTAWDGPISVAVFLPSDRWEAVQHAARVVGTLRHCSPVVKSSTSLHFVIPQDNISLTPGWCWDQLQALLQQAERIAEQDHPLLNDNLPPLPAPWTPASARTPTPNTVWNCKPSAYATLKQLAGKTPASSANVKANANSAHRREDANYARVHAYPNNLLRNIARKHASTPFSLVADIDLIPRPRTLQQDFQKLVAVGDLNPDANGGRVAFVLPAFEVKTPSPPPPPPPPEQYTAAMVTNPVGPATVLDVKQAFNKTLQPFYFDLCWKCQRHTKYDKWLGLGPRTGRKSHGNKQQGERYGDDGAFFMDDHDPVFGSPEATYQVSWHEPWEPFYIAETESVPPFDERFRQYGFNRISQVCHMHMAGFDFTVLRGSFLVHQTQKRVGEFHDSKAAEQDRNRLIFRKLKEELKREFPSDRRCNEAGRHV